MRSLASVFAMSCAAVMALLTAVGIEKAGRGDPRDLLQASRGPTTLSTELRRNVNRLTFWLEYHGPKSSECRSLLLTTEDIPKEEWPNFHIYKLTSDEALGLLDALWHAGFIEEGINNRFKLLEAPREPYYATGLRVGTEGYHRMEIFDRLLVRMLLEMRAATGQNEELAEVLQGAVSGVSKSISERFYERK